MNLIIDIGNTFTKITVFDNTKIISKTNYFQNTTKSIENNDTKTIFSENVLKKYKHDYPKLNNSILSSVINHSKEINHYLVRKFDCFIELNETTKLPIKNLYKSPKTLGKDRIAAAIGANNIFPNTNVLVVDIGTAITFDFVNNNNEYIGGNISPGIDLRLKALHKFTGKLPLLTKNDQRYAHFDFDNMLTANYTDLALYSGVLSGILFEIKGYINTFSTMYDDVKTILTGGDAFYFDKRLKNVIFAEPNLVSIGLNKTLNFNAILK